MKKSKILIPVLSMAGLGATVAPIVVMTSCSCGGIPFVVTADCIENLKAFQENGNFIVTGTFVSTFSGFKKTDSKVKFYFKEGNPEEKTFQEIENEGAAQGKTYITYGEQGAIRITLVKDYITNTFAGKENTKLEMTIVGEGGA